jgi:HD-GYP domain-containing protein (c-di-GMP phosphodiesterase class II)
MNKVLLNKFSKVYIFVIGFSIFPILYLTMHNIRVKNILEILIWIALEVAADLKPFRVMHEKQRDMTMSFAVQLSAVILLGTYPAVFVIIVATLIVEIISKRAWHRALFNAGQYSLSLIATGFLFHLLKLSPVDIKVDIIIDLPAILVAVSVYYILNTFFISAVISLTSGGRFVDIFFSDFKIIASYFYSLAPISIAVVLLYKHDQPYIILIMIPPLVMADLSLRRYYSLHFEAHETLKVLANTVDERDKYTFAHSVHVAEYAKKISEQLGLPLDEINDIELAGQVHDLGKVGIEDKILYKESRLNEEEYDKVKKHPEIAYRLLKNLKPYKKGATYVLYHHEHYDGTGYPRHISGRNIPIGARILSVADSYDAMTTDRPYRKALPPNTAVAELKTCSGTQFDPKVVEAFIIVLKNYYNFVEE